MSQVDIDLREWDAGVGRASQSAWDHAVDDLRRHGGEWPEEHDREWEPLSHIRRRAEVALSRIETGEIVIVTHALVIEALTGVDGRTIENCDLISVIGRTD